jgi:hypothetical protein
MADDLLHIISLCNRSICAVQNRRLDAIAEGCSLGIASLPRALAGRRAQRSALLTRGNAAMTLDHRIATIAPPLALLIAALAVSLMVFAYYH